MRTNLPLLEGIARGLEPLLPELVFVGGATTELFFTAPATPEVRATRDADVICEVAGHVEFFRLGQRLRDLGFREDTTPNAPLCRWRSAVGVLDVMPTDATILGFGNRWYDRAVETSTWTGIGENLRIRVVSPPMFIATKLEAFAGRGGADVLKSHDIEDILAVVAYRGELPEEVKNEPESVRAWIRERISALLVDHPDADYAISGSLAGAGIVPGLIPRVQKRLRTLAGAADT